MDALQLKAYRQMALDRLEQLLTALPEQPHAADYFVDGYIRRLSNLPLRPENTPPYVGLYGEGSTLDRYRDVAVDRLQELVEALPKLEPVDREIDRYLRRLSDLPERPEGVDPYVRLFVLPTSDPEPDEIHAISTPSCPSYLTSEQLLQIAGTNQFKKRITELTPGVNATLERYQINTKLRIAHFLAQVMHESGGCRWLREIWGPTEAQRRYEPVTSVSRSLGNLYKGDGERFKGRGLIQLTGRANYQRFTDKVGKDFGVDFVAQPELVESAPFAVLVAGWFWNLRNVNAAADQDDLLKVTRLVNGGRNGLSDRARYLKRAKLVLKV